MKHEYVLITTDTKTYIPELVMDGPVYQPIKVHYKSAMSMLMRGLKLVEHDPYTGRSMPIDIHILADKNRWGDDEDVVANMIEDPVVPEENTGIPTNNSTAGDIYNNLQENDGLTDEEREFYAELEAEELSKKEAESENNEEL